MNRRNGFTLVELLFMIVIVVLLIAILFPALGYARERANRTECSKRLNGLYKALNTESSCGSEDFPNYAVPKAPANPVEAFNDGVYRVAGNAQLCSMNPMFNLVVASANVSDSVTAPWWLLVRNQSTSPKNFICPSNKESKEDDLTFTDGTFADLCCTWDFKLRNPAAKSAASPTDQLATLSFSIGSPYANITEKNWNANASADWVFAADDNNNDGATSASGAAKLHTLYKSQYPSPQLVQELENSKVHGYEGQNVLFGDGHVSFAQDPFVGPNHNNIYAAGAGSTSPGRPPKVGTHDDDVLGKDDVTLLPVTLGTADEQLRNRVNGGGK